MNNAVYRRVVSAGGDRQPSVGRISERKEGRREKTLFESAVTY
jgi:hypothetical protein